MKALFLVCALALSPMAFNGESKVDTIKKLRDYIRSVVPDAEMVIVPAEQGPPNIAWERFPLTWGGMEIWIKRPTVYDRRAA